MPPPMLTLNGTVLNTFEAPRGTNKAGEAYGGQSKVQLLCDIELQNGEHKADLVTLTVEDIEPFKRLRNRTVSVPVGVFVSDKTAVFFALKGGQPVEAAPAASAAG